MKKVKGAQLMTRLVLGAAFLLMSVVIAHSAEYLSVAKNGVNLRSGPDTKYSVLFELPKGYPLKVITKKGEWVKVSDFENDQGWVYAPLVSTTPYVIVTGKEVNVRSRALITSDKVGEVVREVIFKKTGTQGEWIKVEHPKLKGWIHRKLVWPK